VGKKIILTDRTRMTTLAQCGRKGFWTYYWGGKGIVPKEEALPLLFGGAIHVAFERLLVGGTSVEEAVAEGRKAFEGLEEPLRTEQGWLFECLVRIWAESRLPTLRREFDFLAVEKEILWVLGEDEKRQVVQMIRPDLLARRLSDGELFYIEWKTTGYGDEEWAKSWEKNTQVFCNALAIEETLRERVGGVMIEGLVKGRRQKEWRKSSTLQGQVIQQSALCYAWQDMGGELFPKWANGLTHTPLWTVPGMTPSKWISMVNHGDFLCPVPPITPDREDQELWRIAAEEQMFRVDEGLERIASAPLGEKAKVAARYFPPNYEACYAYRSRCPYWEVCFNPVVRRDPLGNGFILRAPHHEAEKEGAR
jgi:hypothetical protein